MTIPQMRTIAQHMGWTLRGIRRDEVLPQMSAAYRDPALAHKTIERLSLGERRLLAAIAWLGWTPAGHMERALQALQQVLPSGWLLEKPSKVKLLDFVQRGLILRTTISSKGMEGAPPVFAEFLLPIPELVPAPSNIKTLRPDPGFPIDPVGLMVVGWQVAQAFGGVTPNPILDQNEYILTDYAQWPTRKADRNAAYWHQMNRLVPIPSTAPIFPNQFLDKLQLAWQLPPKDPTTRQATVFFATLMYVLGLLDEAPERHAVVANEKSLGIFMAFSPRDAWNKLIEGWVAMAYGLWDELSWAQNRYSDLKVMRRGGMWSFNPPAYSQELSRFRREVLGTLRWLPDPAKDQNQGWVDVAAFSRLVGGVVPHIIMSAGRQGNWLLTTQDEKAYDPEDTRGWEQGSGRILTLILEGPLHWLGIVETAHNAEGRLAAVRLTRAGAALLAGEELPRGKPEPPQWGDDFTVLVAPTVATGQLMTLLHQHAESEGLHAGRMHYRFTPESAQASFEAGSVPADIHAAFAGVGVPLPKALVEALDRWWQRWGLVHRYDELALIELVDEFLVKELLVTTNLGEYVVARCGPTALAIAPQDVEKVIQLLQRGGYMPKVVNR